MIFTPALLFALSVLNVHATPVPSPFINNVGIVGDRNTGKFDSSSSPSPTGPKVNGNVGPNSGHTAANSIGAGASPSNPAEPADINATSGSSSSVAINVNNGVLNVNGDGPNCSKICGTTSYSSFESDGKCYCAAEAQKLSDCVFRVDPTWPLLPPKRPAGNAPSPIDDPEGFDKYIEDSIPQDDPNSDQVVRNCIASTGVQATA